METEAATHAFRSKRSEMRAHESLSSRHMPIVDGPRTPDVTVSFVGTEEERSSAMLEQFLNE
jgi:hypothetical protein